MVQGMIQQETAIRTMLGRTIRTFISRIGLITATAQQLGLTKVTGRSSAVTLVFHSVASRSGRWHYFSGIANISDASFHETYKGGPHQARVSAQRG